MFINNEIKNNRDNLITRHFSGLLNEKKEKVQKEKKVIKK